MVDHKISISKICNKDSDIWKEKGELKSGYRFEEQIEKIRKNKSTANLEEFTGTKAQKEILTDYFNPYKKKIHEHRPRHVSPAGRLVKVDIDPLQLRVGRLIALELSGRVHAVLVADDLPELGPDLVPALTSLNLISLPLKWINEGSCEVVGGYEWWCRERENSGNGERGEIFEEARDFLCSAVGIKIVSWREVRWCAGRDGYDVAHVET
ncbi:orotate phosphoribosyltransferase [Striga asiatica]|uniref:Orotate phosphoribosyltransferase n=1 Tax=Striga asiatica TaxID=4170 RepID=A0A5A7RIG6_STRAF|nr:orotate phosphoribosyltransferase [Striga asiatica]